MRRVRPDPPPAPKDPRYPVQPAQSAAPADSPAPISSGFPTVAEVLALDQVRQGNPRVVAGTAGLDRRVRWVHVTELTEVGLILRGGELVLSTGIAWPEDRDALAKFVADLAAVGAAGLVVELGRRYPEALPKPLVLAAEKHRLPVITLGRDTRFITITEAVHARIIDAQLAELRNSEEVHQTFNELAVEGAEPLEVVRQIAKMAGHPVVLENLAHQVLVYDAAGTTPEALLDGWEGRSRSVRPASRTAYDERSGWLTTIVGARGQDWGRLVVICDGVPAPAPSRLTMLAERGAATLALNRLMQRDRETLERQTHRTLLTAILNHDHSAAEVALRARAVGVALEGRRLVGVVLRLRGSAPAAGAGTSHGATIEAQARLRELTDYAAAAVREKRFSALIGAVDEHSVGLLLALGPQDREETALDTFSATVRRLTGPDNAQFAIAVGTSVGAVRDARRSLLEAIQVADAAVRQTGGPAYHRLVDVRLRGLLHLLRDDARLQTYVERELGPLLAHDNERGTNLIAMLGSTSTRAATSPPPRTPRTCPGRPSTSGCTGSSGYSAWIWTRSSRACRCTSPCSHWTRCGTADASASVAPKPDPSRRTRAPSRPARAEQCDGFRPGPPISWRTLPARTGGPHVSVYPPEITERQFGDPATPPGWVGAAPPSRPIELSEPDPAWPARFAAEAARIAEALGAAALRIEHVGSTSVPGLPAKPIIDIDVQIADTEDEEAYLPPLEQSGFRLILREPWWNGHRMLVPADPADPADTAVNLHIFPAGAPEPLRHLLFRDWLRAHPEDRDLYAATKRSLADSTADRPNDYSLAKNTVIDDIYTRIFSAPPESHPAWPRDE